jgi:hypothetical protein
MRTRATLELLQAPHYRNIPVFVVDQLQPNNDLSNLTPSCEQHTDCDMMRSEHHDRLTN